MPRDWVGELDRRVMKARTGPDGSLRPLPDAEFQIIHDSVRKDFVSGNAAGNGNFKRS